MYGRVLTGVCAVAISAGVASANIVKPPDVGPWWQPLNGTSGSYVYASDFIAPEGPNLTVDCLGTWLFSTTGTTQSLRFEIWGHNAGPNPNAVLTTTGSIHPNVTGPLDLYTESVLVPYTLTAGERYWFVATVVGESGGASYQFGGHTQNSVYPDNGTFWFSNDPNGINFDGQNFTPQIAFVVCLVPAPGALALVGLAGLVGVRRRRN